MPGIYINDGGATSSALGNALGGLATSLSPETAARAKLLWLQSEGADIANQGAIDTTQGKEDQASVADTLAKLGQPGTDPNAPVTLPPLYTDAGGRTSHYVRPTTAIGALIASRGLQGGDVNDLRSAITLGQEANPAIGPGNTFEAVGKRATTPLSPGTVINTTGQPGSPTISGGSTYTSEGERAGAASDNDLAQKDSVLGAAATSNLGVAQNLEQLYDATVAEGNANPLDIAKTELGRKLSAALGMDLGKFDSMEGVKKEITNRYLSMVGTMKTSQGDPLVRGGLPNVMAQFPDADTSPNSFHRMSATLKASLARQVADGKAADEFLANRTKLGEGAAVAYRQQRGNNAAAEAQAQASVGFKPGEAGGGSEGGSGGAVYIFPDQASAEAAVNGGHLPKGTKVKIGGPNGPSFTVGE